MSIKWLAINGCRSRIRRVEIVRESDKCVWIATTKKPHRRTAERKEAKESSLGKYCDSFQEAQQYLVNRARARIEEAEKAISKERALITKLMAMEDTP